MWKHEIRDKLRLVKWLGENKSAVRICDDTRGDLENSVQFFFGDVAQWAINDGKCISTSFYFPPPYKSTLIEFFIQNTKYNIKMPCATLYTYTDKTNTPVIVSMYYDKISDIWVLFPASCRYEDGEWQLYIAKDISSEYSAYVENASYGFVANTMFLLQLLNTRNIVTKCKIPPEKLNKKRIKHHHTPYEKYYILEVVKGVPKTKHMGDVPWDYKSPADVAFHMCRGHFKTYTEDAPLFGKYTGTFWWQPQARGKKESGVITKDYSVTLG